MIGLQIGCYLRFPFIAIAQKLLLIIEQFFVRLCREFKIGALNNRIDWTGLLQMQHTMSFIWILVDNNYLTKTAIDAFGHVNIVSRGAPAAIGAFFGLNGNCLSGANSFAKLARNATLLTAWITAKGMLTTEPWTQRSFLEWVINCGRLLKDVGQCDGKASKELTKEHCGSSTICDILHFHAQLLIVNINIALGHTNDIFRLGSIGRQHTCAVSAKHPLTCTENILYYLIPIQKLKLWKI